MCTRTQDKRGALVRARVRSLALYSFWNLVHGKLHSYLDGLGPTLEDDGCRRRPTSNVRVDRFRIQGLSAQRPLSAPPHQVLTRRSGVADARDSARLRASQHGWLILLRLHRKNHNLVTASRPRRRLDAFRPAGFAHSSCTSDRRTCRSLGREQRTPKRRAGRLRRQSCSPR